MTVRLWRVAYLAVVAAFLIIVATYYSRETGLTVFLGLPANSHSSELPDLQAVPHAHDELGGGYDGQFYVQMALDPLLADSAIDHALDNPGYRSHRILFSWTAWALGLGRPNWIVHVYAAQNVVVWLMLAWVLCVWCPSLSARSFVLWAGVMLSHGLLISVRNAVPDGPSVLLTAVAVLAMDRGRPWLSAIVTGVGGLARETNVLAGVVLLRSATSGNWFQRAWRLAALGFLCVLPIALWFDYLRSIYHEGVFTGGDHITVPLSGLWWKLTVTAGQIQATGLTVHTVANIVSLAALAGQVAALVWCTRQARHDQRGSRSWLLVAWTFLVLGLVSHQVVWNGTPGAFTRVMLPVTVGVNALLAAYPRAPWALIIVANLSVVSGLMAFVWGWV